MMPMAYERSNNPSSVTEALAGGADPAGRCRRGFTLIEVLAALAISSVIIVATVALIHTVARSFDRGTRGIDAADRLMQAVQRLAEDFASARFVVWRSESGPALAFRSEPAAGDKPARIVFVAGAGSASVSPADEIVSLTIERHDDVMRLVRRRAPWTGPDMVIGRVSMHDPVVLIEGDLDMSFLFGRLDPGGALLWSPSWIGQTTLPRFVRLKMRDRASGYSPVGEADFIVRADAPVACARPDAGSECLSRLLPEAKPRAPAPARGPG
jgi:prepilin-type N-terminal cleavage/methylation domain-containing protein